MVVPTVQWALNTAWRPSIGTTPFTVMVGREPRTGFAALVEEADKGWPVKSLTPVQVERETELIVEVQEKRRRNVLYHKKAGRAKSREHASREELPHLSVSDFALVARVRKTGPHSKLMSRWTGPWRVLSDDREHVYEVQHLITGETRYAHVVPMRFYADKESEVTRRMTKVLQYLEHQAQYHIERIGWVKKAEYGDEYVVRVYWQGLDEEESTWDLVSKVLADAPAVLRAQLKQQNLKQLLKRALKTRYALTV